MTGPARSDRAAADAAQRAAATMDEDEGALRRQPELDMTIAAGRRRSRTNRSAILARSSTTTTMPDKRKSASVRSAPATASSPARRATAALDPDDGIAL